MGSPPAIPKRARTSGCGGTPQHRAEEVGQQVVPAIEQRRHQPPVGVGVAVEPGGGLVERAVEERRRRRRQRMGQGHGRMGPPQPVILEAEGVEGR